MLDIFLLIVIAWSLYSGWRNGFIHELLSMAGYFVGIFIAAMAYRHFGEFLTVSGSQANIVTSLIAFVVLWVVAPIALGMVGTMLTKVAETLWLGKINSLLGALVSFIKFFILLGCILTALNALGILNKERIKESVMFSPIQANFAAFVDNAFGVNIDQYTGHEQAPATNTPTASDTLWVDAQR
ncbi:MAG: CvpA family protein [Bacteroidaceae bacterium]|nr:CvpA family protein [Bacteroidaceae bacterium]